MPGPGNGGNQSPNNILGQSSASDKAKTAFNKPDTDSRLIKIINGITSVVPNFMHDHTRLEYIAPTGNVATVNFQTPINVEDRGLHWLVIDNSNNIANKSFVFSADYVFLDDPSNVSNTYTITPNDKMVWFATWTAGKLYLRKASESTM